MHIKDYVWERNYYGERTIEALDELKNVLNSIESVSDLIKKIYTIQVKYEDLNKWYIIIKYLAELECYFPKEKEKQNDD